LCCSVGVGVGVGVHQGVDHYRALSARVSCLHQMTKIRWLGQNAPVRPRPCAHTNNHDAYKGITRPNAQQMPAGIQVERSVLYIPYNWRHGLTAPATTLPRPQPRFPTCTKLARSLEHLCCHVLVCCSVRWYGTIPRQAQGGSL
jgi:hypothetical protein